MAGKEPKGRGDAAQRIVRAFLVWEPGEQPFTWPSQSDLASGLAVTRQRIGQAIVAARQRWSRFPSITHLRGMIQQLLQGLGGIATHEEVIRAVLAAHGSALDPAEALHYSAVATRAALETEKQTQSPRFEEYRSGDRIFLALHPDLKGFAHQLGRAADQLALQDPLASATKALETLRAVKPPQLPAEIALPGDSRLPQLAVAASSQAALSPRLEIYPRGLAPARALALAQNALFGCTLTLDEMRDRVRSRYPDSAPLPDRPQLDKLVEEIGLGLEWKPDAADGKGAYEPVYRNSLSIQTSESIPERRRTHVLPLPTAAAVDPSIAAARVLEEKLQRSADEGAFLVLSVEGRFLRQAWQELQRFNVEPLNLDSLFLQTMKSRAEALKVRWDIVLQADAAEPGSTDWRRLQQLVTQCLPTIEQALRQPGRTRLLLNPGLLARYQQLHLLQDLANDVGRKDGIHGLWILVPASGQAALPTLNHQAIPITNAAQHAQLTEDWIFNRHRSTPA